MNPSHNPQYLAPLRLALLLLVGIVFAGCLGGSPAPEAHMSAGAVTPTQNQASSVPATIPVREASPTPDQAALSMPLTPLAPGEDGAIISLTFITSTRNSEYYRLLYWSDGLKIAGFLGRPKASGPHPAVIYNRGGNQDLGALRPMHMVELVEAGFVTVGSQYRGGPGSEGQEEFGGADLHDVLNLIPLLKQMPEVDPERIGMVGFSRGGLMTYLALKHQTMVGSNDIKVAAVIGGMTDLFLTGAARPPMISEVFVPLIGVHPDQDREPYEERSATYWPELINTPILIQHGQLDWRVPIVQVNRLVAGLEGEGKVMKFIVHPDGDHGLSNHHYGYEATLDWLQQYLGAPGTDHTFKRHQKAIEEVFDKFDESLDVS
jgi:dipeptidyl aminopeptidase/acylaminoacyl peptidase